MSVICYIGILFVCGFSGEFLFILMYINIKWKILLYIYIYGLWSASENKTRVQHTIISSSIIQINKRKCACFASQPVYVCVYVWVNDNCTDSWFIYIYILIKGKTGGIRILCYLTYKMNCNYFLFCCCWKKGLIYNFKQFYCSFGGLILHYCSSLFVCKCMCVQVIMKKNNK